MKSKTVKSKKIRKKIPDETIATVMHKVDMACCVCHKRIAGQIHHINSDPSDNREENLVWLCLAHHNLTSTRSPLSKCPLPPELIKTYKREWEASVAKSRQNEASKSETPHNRSNYQYDIERVALEILSTNDSNIDSLEEKFKLLWHFALLKKYKDEVLNVFENTLLSSGGSAKNTQDLIATYLPVLFVEMVPQITQWKNGIDDSRFKTAIDLLTKVGLNNSTIFRNDKAFDSVCYGLNELFTILLLYKKKGIAKKILDSYKKLLSSSNETIKGLHEQPYHYGIECLNELKGKIEKQIKVNKIDWKSF